MTIARKGVDGVGEHVTAGPRLVSKTRSFSTVFIIEMWERFGFYGLQALIIFYMVQQLNLSDTDANLTWGTATVLMYVTPVAGGWLGDRFFGTRRTMTLGAVVLAIGYALMAVPARSTHFLFITLGVIIAGEGLFKANSSNLVRLIYEGDEARIDSSATIYYMSINVGAMISMLLTPVIKGYFNAPFHGQLVWLLGSYAPALFGNGLGWHAAFSVSCVGLLVGVSNYVAMRYTLAQIGSVPDHHPFSVWRLLVVLLGTIITVLISSVILKYSGIATLFVYASAVGALAIYAYAMRICTSGERNGIIIAFIFLLEFSLFFVFNQQNSTSLSLFALRNTSMSFGVFGFHLWTWHPAQLQSFNSIWIVVLSPMLALLYTSRAKRGTGMSVAMKFSLGYLAIGVGFFIYAAGGQFFSTHGETTSWTIIAGYGFQSLGELLTSALGLAFIARYVPTRISGLLLGVNLVAAGVVSYVGAVVASLAAVPDNVRVVAHALSLTGTVRQSLPQVLAMKLSDFRGWMAGAEGAQHAAARLQLAPYGSLPEHAQVLLRRFNEEITVATMPHYVHLFFWLGVAGIACAVVTQLVRPIIRRLEDKAVVARGVSDRS